MNSRQLFSPAAERNSEPIARVLCDVLPERGLVLEIASGTGQHAAYFARRFSDVVWQPTDPDRDARESIGAYREGAAKENLLPPLELDVTRETWPVEKADAILAVNMIHISPWEATVGLFEGASRVLPPSAPLILYGPYFVEGIAPAPSNVDFDLSLRGRNPDWGVRRLEDVTEIAKRYGFDLESVTEMPANNLTVVFRSTAKGTKRDLA